MDKIHITYNPYIVKTVILINDIEIEDEARLYEKRERRLQEWIEPSKEWKGFFGELYDYLNSSKPIEIVFHGTELDYQDLLYANDKYGSLFENVEISFEPSLNQSDRLEELKEAYKELMESEIEELRDEEIQNAFENALSSEFNVVVCAPMSSGKSTLINALLGTNILPANTQATTAIVTKIKDIDSQERFVVSYTDVDRNTVVNEEANWKVLNNINNKANESGIIENINITGNIPGIPSNKVNLVLIDTPGGDYIHNSNHGEIMKKAINDKNKGMILYVFDVKDIGKEGTKNYLKMAKDALDNIEDGKLGKDRFLFVANKMDSVDPSKESYDTIIDNVKKDLQDLGLEDPRLFLVSSETCRLIRMNNNKEDLTEAEKDDLESLVKKMNREKRRLYENAPISDLKKKEYDEIVEAHKNENNNLTVAEINSGIPALEEAIKVYIEKYAQAMKIRSLHDAFMKRVKLIDAQGTILKKCNESDEERMSFREELEKKTEAFKKDKTLETLKGRVNRLNAEFKEANQKIEKMTTTFRNILNKYQYKVEKNRAQGIIKECLDELTKAYIDTQQSIKIELDQKLYNQCKSIYKEYEKYIKQLDKKGVFNIGGFNYKSITGITDISYLSLVNSIDNYSSNEVVNTRREKEKGVINFIKRVLHIGGYTEVNDTMQKVDLRKLFKDKVSDNQVKITQALKDEIRNAESLQENLKREINKELDDISTKIIEKQKELEYLTRNKEEVEYQYEKNKKNYEWIKEFIIRIERILYV